MGRAARRIVVLALLAIAAVFGRRALVLPLGPDRPELSTFVAPPTRATPPVEIVPLRMGSSTAPRCGPAGQASCLHLDEVVHAAFVVKHPKATFLIDAGLSAHGHDDVARFPFPTRKVLEFQPGGTLATGLTLAGAKPAFAILTHAHWDHSSGLQDLDHPRVIVGPGEIELIRNWPKDAEPAVMPDHFEGARLESFTWDGPAYENFPASHDLLGDGSVVVVPLPGHTPGSLGVFVNNVHGKRVLFVGDAAWARTAIELPSHKLRPVSSHVDRDPAKLSDTLWRLHALHEHDPELLIVPTHDAAAWAELHALNEKSAR